MKKYIIDALYNTIIINRFSKTIKLEYANNDYIELNSNEIITIKSTHNNIMDCLDYFLNKDYTLIK